MSIPVLTVAQMRQWEDASWAAEIRAVDVIERVGGLLAARLLELTGPGDPLLLVQGRGHNGDDLRAAARRLPNRVVHSLDVGDPSIAVTDLERLLKSSPVLIVDGLFGIGLNRAIEGPWLRLIQLMNGSGVPIISVDVPSGLDATTGAPLGDSIRAHRTLTLGAPKVGLLAGGAAKFVGRLEVLPDIGLLPVESQGFDAMDSSPSPPLAWTHPDEFRNFLPPRAVDSNKGTFGHTLIYAGSLGFHGAALLATQGALRARPGLVTLYTPQDVYVPIASQTIAAMVHPWRPGLPPPANTKSILIGPGLAGTGIRAAMETEVLGIWRRATSVVVADASALDWLTPVPLGPVPPRIMTPHPGEAAKMLRRSVEEVQADRPGTVRELSRRYSSCWVVLKGHQTLVGSAEGPIYVNPSGNPDLAQGGTGDLLAGLIAGLFAQPALATDPLKTLRYAVWRHGASADKLTAQKPDWTVQELAAAL